MLEDEGSTKTTHIRFIVQAGVGELEYTVRIQNGVIKIPSVGEQGFVEGRSSDSTTRKDTIVIEYDETKQRIERERQEWAAWCIFLANN